MQVYRETEFKETPIGKIPEDWEVVRLKEVLILLRNGLTYKQNKKGVGYPITRIETISDERIDPNKVGFVNNIKKEELEEYRLKIGDILFSHINSLDHIGKTAIYEGEPEILLHGMNLLLLRPDRQKIEPYYLLYLLRLYRKIGVFKNMAKKAVNQASINQTELGKVKIPLPPIEEQRKIAEILSTVDKAIEKVDEAIAKTERLKKGLMQELSTKGIGHKEFKDTEIGRIPKEWEVVKIEDIVANKKGAIKMGPFGSQIKKSEMVEKGPIKVYGQENVIKKDFNIGNRFITLEKYNQLKNFEIYPEDVLITMMGSVGYAAVFPKEAQRGVMDSHLLRIQVDKNKILPIFLAILINDFMTIKYQIKMLSQGAIMSGLNSKIVRSLKIPLPPLPEQQKIAEILSTIDKKLELERKRKEKLERIKKGLMNDLLTGKRRVKV